MTTNNDPILGEAVTHLRKGQEFFAAVYDHRAPDKRRIAKFVAGHDQQVEHYSSASPMGIPAQDTVYVRHGRRESVPLVIIRGSIALSGGVK